MTAPTTIEAPAPESTETVMAGETITAQASPAPGETSFDAADGIREAVSSRGGTVGDIIDYLDALALSIGNTRISVWDGLVVVAVILAIFLLAWFGSRLARRAVNRMTRFDPSQRLLADKLLTIAVWAMAILIGIDLLGIDLTALAVFSGAFGLAIGFGLQKTFGNLIAGIILLMDKSIKPGDVISVADSSGQESFGQIRKIGIRAISVVTRDKTEYLIPNEMLMINQVVNWSYSSRDVRVKAPVGVAYGSDIELVEKLLLEAVKDAPRVLDTPAPRVNLTGFGDSSVDFEIRFWILDPEEGMSNIRSDVYKRVWKLFKENGIEIPFPQRDLNLRGNEQFDRLVEAIAQRIERKDA